MDWHKLEFCIGQTLVPSKSQIQCNPHLVLEEEGGERESWDLTKLSKITGRILVFDDYQSNAEFDIDWTSDCGCNHTDTYTKTATVFLDSVFRTAECYNSHCREKVREFTVCEVSSWNNSLSPSSMVIVVTRGSRVNLLLSPSAGASVTSKVSVSSMMSLSTMVIGRHCFFSHAPNLRMLFSANL